VREVRLSADATHAIVTMTPTFVGCPALIPMREEIVECIQALGVTQVEVNVSLNPPWTSQWISDATREKLKSICLAPPPKHTGEIKAALLRQAACPNCDSTDTVMDSLFGPTACRSLYYCNHCKQSFEQFKPL
jgi:ring-1,2-phenylacetyl-CoA epoxidase subunit PaaD